MIALPGLTLSTGSMRSRAAPADLAQHVDQGMLPNRFPDAGEAPEYNAVDAPFCFTKRLRLPAYTGDIEFVRTELYAVFADIISWHVAVRVTESKWIPVAC